jgi:hypothetical protein
MTHQDRDQSVEQWLRKTPAVAAPGDLCLDADTLAAWAEGALAGDERASAEAHASTCERCQAMLAVMVRTMPVPERSTGSQIRKWLMMLSPAMAAAAAVALWFAVDQRQPPVSSAVDSLSKAQARDESVARGPSLTVATESDRKAPIVSSDRGAQKADRGVGAEPADAGRSRELRGPSAAAVPATPPQANERKDLGTPKRSPPPPALPAEGLQAAAGNRTPAAPPPPGPAPQQQANQAQNQAQNQAVVQAQSPAVQTQQTQSQGQTPRQQPPAALEERVVIADKPVGRAAAESSATGRAAGRGGTTAALADAAKLAYREGAGFELAVAASSVRWRVADGRTVQRSLDAGANFSTQYTAERGVLLTAGAAPSAEVCWLVGRAGAVILSTDGRVWRRLTFPEQVDLAAVTATDARTATVTTADGRRFGTADGGGTWVKQ